MTSESGIYNVKKMSSIILSRDKIIVIVYSILVGLHTIRSNDFRNACWPEKPYQHFSWGARRLNNGNYILNLQIKLYWFQQSTIISMVGLNVLMGSSKLSWRLRRSIVYCFEKLFDQYISSRIIQHQVALITYGLLKIIWILLGVLTE